MTLATIESGLFVALTWILTLGWLRQLILWLLNFSLVKDLNYIDLPFLPALIDEGVTEESATSSAPQLTVIVPACNEEASIAATLRRPDQEAAPVHPAANGGLPSQQFGLLASGP